MATAELGILAAGNMAEAIVRGVIRGGLLQPGQIIASDLSPERRELFARELGVRITDDNATVVRQSRMLLLSVKPQHMGELLGSIGPVASPDTLFISIAAGISSRLIEARLGGQTPWHVVRTMPNTPMLVNEGMVALSRGQFATAQDLDRAKDLFASAAAVIEVREDQLDAVTAVSGSGPAYVFYLVEQMILAGIELGLSADQARQLAGQTAAGAAKMLTSSADNPEELRRRVTSPGGTTQAAITYLQQHHVAEALVEAIKAAAARSRELGT